MAAKKLMNVYEALEYLENLNVSSGMTYLARRIHLKVKIGHFTSRRGG